MRCDFAETYHITDFEALPIDLAATLAAGLREPSRSYRAYNGVKLTLEQSLSAMMLDTANMILWTRSEDAKHNRNRPNSVYERLTAEPDENELEGETIEEFDRWYSEKMG